MNTITTYFKGVWSELKKVTWPTRTEVINHTIIVIVSAAVAVAVTAGADYGLSRLIKFIIQNKS
ncbi:MAG: preprotein translocase subunit SecE [Candidatus Berkelbacteria bacterium]|nr:preprotein translocase subunit SecE [Candidatus Berkelbacteria bacterium]